MTLSGGKNKGGMDMKKKNVIWAILAVSISLAACTREPTLQKCESREETVKLVPMTFQASFETDTKTVLDGLNVQWVAGDEIAVFDDKDPTKAHKFIAKSSGSTTSFEGAVSENASRFIAIYPYDAVESFSMEPIADGSDKYRTGTLIVPGVQEATPGGFDPKANICVAQATIGEQLYFRLFGGLLKVTITRDDVIGVNLSATSGYYLTGKCYLRQYETKNFPNANNVSSSEMSRSVTLKHADGSALAAGDYYIVVRHSGSGNYSGFSASLFTKDYKVGKRTASNPLALSRKEIKNLGNFAGLSFVTNLYECYQAGYDIKIGGTSYNKATHGDARLLSSGPLSNSNVVKDVNGNGILFLQSGATFTYSGAIGINTDVVVSSTDPANPAILQPAKDKYWNLQSGTLIMNGLKFDCFNLGDDTMLFSNASASGSSEKLGLYYCSSNNLKRYLYSTNGSQFDKVIKEIEIDHCILGVVRQNSSALINPNSSDHTAAEKFEKFTFTNNILYDANGNNDSNGVVIFNYNPKAEIVESRQLAKKSWPMAVTIENNIFYNVSTSGGSFKHYRVSSASIKNNVLTTDNWNSSTLPTNNMKLFNQIYTKETILADGELSMTVGHNLGYGELGNNGTKPCEWVVANSAFVKGLEKMVKGTETPFETADLSTGTFVLKTAYSSYGPQ